MSDLLNLLKIDSEEKITHQLIDTFYFDSIRSSGPFSKLIQPLELNQYLERFLWPLYKDKRIENVGHLMSIVAMVNQKFRERVPAWETFISSPDEFDAFFTNVCRLCLAENRVLNMKERRSIIIFLDHCFNSVEVDLIRDTIQKFVSFSMWICLSDNRRVEEFKKVTKLEKYWKKLKEKDGKLSSTDPQSLEKDMFARKFLWNMINQFFRFLATIPGPEEVDLLDKVQLNVVSYCERFVEFLIDLEALLPTRRFFNAVLDDTHAVIICRRSKLAQRSKEGHLFNQLVEILTFYCKFEIDDLSGEALTPKDIMKKHYDTITKLQTRTFKDFESLKIFYLSNVAAIDTPKKLVECFQQLDDDQLVKLMTMLNLISEPSNGNKSIPRELFLDIIASKYGRVISQLEALNEMPLYPTEEIIWDENLVPNQYFDNDSCLALPKLNLKFLTLHDYLLRNHKLFRLESTFEIRQDIESSVSRMKPWKREDGVPMFGGWARMAIAIDSFVIVEVAKPNVGEKAPSRVRAEIKVNLNVRHEIKREWESLRKHDVCFLITVEPTVPPGTAYKYKEPFKPQVGLKYVRGCEIQGMLDPTGRLIDETTQEKPYFDTDFRTYRVWLDCNQYYLDNINLTDGQESVYETFNILLRRKPKENNFKAVLETVRDLMNSEFVVPDWLHNIILGYDDPSAAHYTKMIHTNELINFNDTFLDYDHLLQSFPKYDVTSPVQNESKLIPPFKLKIDEKSKKVEVFPFVQPNRGPYPAVQPKKNSIRFTPTQIEAIKSGVHRGLTLVVGPPGTGKTDIAVQIISNLYHNFPHQRTLIVTHSNQALNALFEKIMNLDIDERHLLRLGHGEEELDTVKDFSRYGRVNYVLAKRLELLDEVSRLAVSLGVTGAVSFTCETANYFYLYHILSRWEEFQSKLSESAKEPADVSRLFPFGKFFDNAPQPVFKKATFEQDLEIAKGCYRYLKKIFTQLDEFRAFEMLRTGAERSRYLLVREAKIIAMTCTHAALKRRELVEIGFQYDNILMEEAAQILEIETFIPLLLQNPEHGHNRLKRWIMIGDHHQLPPVIKNMAFQKYSNMEQSLFTRFVRLGVSTIELDAQGRSRPSLCSLYRERYKQLDDLPHTRLMSESFPVNPGFLYDYQLIDVEDFNGVGESEPIPYFYQNLAEAEFVVATYMFMRLIGYPAEKITILTTYNGQKHLIRDVITQRCAKSPLIGPPSKVTTVDKFQGLQNDFILLSLVRTKTVGHLRDVRRLIVAMSRAKFGLYVFGRVSLFKRCIELAPTFKHFLERPTSLDLFPNEMYPNTVSDRSESPSVFNQMPEMVQFVYNFHAEKMKTMPIEVNESEKEEKEEKESPMEDEVQMESVNEGNDDQDDQDDNEKEDEVLFEKLGPDDSGTEDKIEIDSDE